MGLRLFLLFYAKSPERTVRLKAAHHKSDIPHIRVNLDNTPDDHIESFAVLRIANGISCPNPEREEGRFFTAPL